MEKYHKILKINLTTIKIKQLRANKLLPPLTTYNTKRTQISLILHTALLLHRNGCHLN